MDESVPPLPLASAAECQYASADYSRGDRLRDLAPKIQRQRLLLEGYYSIAMNREAVTCYLTQVAAHLGLRTYAEPVIYTPSGEGKQANQGFDAFIPLIDSGISLYIWSEQRFFSALLYTCKAFDEAAAISYTRTFFSSDEVVHSSF
jgi:S-adenosylmethionine/arginine decarboxylase-like enzyme